jgi:hypothetical protein
MEFQVGDLVEETKLFKYIDLKTGKQGIIKEVFPEGHHSFGYVLIEGRGGWCHSIKSLKLIKRKNNMEMEKKLIGYKLIKPEYHQAVKQITRYNTFDFIELKDGEGADYQPVEPETRCYYKLKEAGVLDLWFEPVYEEKEFKIGDWVSFYSERENKTITSKIKELTPHSYCKLENGLQPFKTIIRLATSKEIKHTLIEEAKKRGFIIGAKVKTETGINLEFAHLNGKITRYDYYLQDDVLDGSNGYIYKQGEWAELVKESAKFFDIKVEYLGKDLIKIGCKTFTKKELQSKLTDIDTFCSNFSGNIPIKHIKIELVEILK